jgi:PAP2 superfamily.
MTGVTTTAVAAAPSTARPWRRALLWLAVLGPFFFASYGFANWMAARQPVVPVLVFGWESAIPFLPWTIVPYWSIDAFYALSLLLCRQRLELDRHALRLLSAQLIAVTCFLLWPLRFSFQRPATDGVYGWLFDVLLGFDKPFNQAPSLHIVLLVVLWVKFAQYLHGHWRWLLHGWALLIGVSVLTTFQHHFIDIPTGLLVGWLCVWLWPEQGTPPLRAWQATRDRRRWRLAMLYLLGAALLILPALWLGGAALWLLWPVTSLLLVALGYAGLGVAVFQKRADGRLGWPRAGCWRRTWARPGSTRGCGPGARRSRWRWPTGSGWDGCRAAHCRRRCWRWSTPAPSCPARRRARPMPACRCLTWWCRILSSCALPPRPSSACARTARCWCAGAGVFAQCRQCGDLAAVQRPRAQRGRGGGPTARGAAGIVLHPAHRQAIAMAAGVGT